MEMDSAPAHTASESLTSRRSLVIIAVALAACALLVAVVYTILKNSFYPDRDTLFEHLLYANDEGARSAAAKLARRDDAVRFLIDRLGENRPARLPVECRHWCCLECWSTMLDGTRTRSWQEYAFAIIAEKRDPAAVLYLEKFLDDPEKYHTIDRRLVHETLARLCAPPPR